MRQRVPLCLPFLSRSDSGWAHRPPSGCPLSATGVMVFRLREWCCPARSWSGVDTRVLSLGHAPRRGTWRSDGDAGSSLQRPRLVSALGPLPWVVGEAGGPLAGCGVFCGPNVRRLRIRS